VLTCQLSHVETLRASFLTKLNDLMIIVIFIDDGIDDGIDEGIDDGINNGGDLYDGGNLYDGDDLYDSGYEYGQDYDQDYDQNCPSDITQHMMVSTIPLIS
jgi:hypothetical protein